MELNYNPTENGCEVIIKGELTIEQASALKEAMEEALKQEGDILLDLSPVEKVDMSCLQILCSAHRSLLAQGRNAILQKTSEAFNRTLQKSGLEGYQGCSRETTDKCLWTGGTNK